MAKNEIEEVTAVEIEADGRTVVIKPATAMQGMRRTLLQYQASQVDSSQDEEALQILRTIIYPDLVGSVVQHEGFEQWPPSFEMFCELPDQFVSAWEKATYEANPHWEPGYDEAEEKKEPTISASDSASGTGDSKS